MLLRNNYLDVPSLNLWRKRLVTPVKLEESRPSTQSGANLLTTKDGTFSARDVKKTTSDTFTLVDHHFDDSDLSSNLPTSDEEELRNNSAQLSDVEEFSSQIFVPSNDSAINTASSNSTSQISQDLLNSSSKEKRTIEANKVVHQLFSDPKAVASTNFNDLVSKLTTSLAKLEPINNSEEGPIRRASRVEPITNPFHPLYSSSTALSKAKKPILPLEGGNENFFEDTPTFKPLIPRLDALYASNSDVKRPTDALVGLSQHNPFRLEAWNDHEEREHHLAATARPYNGTKTYDNFQQIYEFDSTTNNGYIGDDEHENPEEQHRSKYDEDEFEVECPVRLSSSLPNTTRKPAPCAIAYPSTSVFIRLVNSAFEAGLAPQTKFFVDGCCTVSLGFLIDAQ